MSWRLLRTLAWLQWRLVVNRVLESGKRDAVERASRISEIALKVLIGLLLLPAALIVAAGGAMAGWTLADGGRAVVGITIAATAMVAVPTVWVVIRPLLSMGEAGSGSATLLRLLPVPRTVFSNLELLRSVLDPVVLLFAPATVLLPLGMIAGGAVTGGLLAAAAGILLLATVAALGSTMALGMQLVARRRGRAELVTLVVVLLLSVSGLLPQVLLQRGPEGRPAASTAAPRAVVGDALVLPPVVRYTPPGLYGTALAGAATHDRRDAAVALAFLLVTAGALILLSQAILERLLTSSSSGGSGRTGAGAAAIGWRPAVAASPLLALASAEARAHLRTVRGKIAVVSPALMMPLMAIAFRRHAGVASPVPLGPMPVVFLALFGPLSVAVLSVNQFAVIRGGQLLESVLPVSTRTLLAAKLVATTALVALATTAGAAALLLVDSAARLPFVIAAVLAGLAAHVAVAPLAAILSALFPKPVELSAIGRGSQPHGVAAVLNMLGTLIVILPGAGMAVGAFLLTRRTWAAPAAAAVAVVLAGVVAHLALPFAARVVAARRENITLVASGH